MLRLDEGIHKGSLMERVIDRLLTRYNSLLKFSYLPSHLFISQSKLCLVTPFDLHYFLIDLGYLHIEVIHSPYCHLNHFHLPGVNAGSLLW